MTDSYVLWKVDARECLGSFLNSELSINTLTALLEQFNLGTCINGHAPTSAAKLALIHNTQDVLLSSSEIEYLEYAPQVIMAQNDPYFKIFALEVKTTEDEFYYVMAAIIKILNFAFSSQNLFFVKCHDKMSVGCKRNFREIIANNFCQSDLLGNSSCLIELLSLDFQQLQDFVPDILARSSLEHGSLQYDRKAFSTEYIEALSDVEHALGIDFTEEKERYFRSFEVNEHLRCTHDDICKALKYIAESSDVLSSYEALAAAEAAAEKVAKAESKMDYTHDEKYVGPDTIDEFDEKTLSNAELLLNALELRDRKSHRSSKQK